MAVRKPARLRKPRAVYLIHWIFELRLSLVALVIGMRMYVSRLARRLLSVLATFLIGASRERWAQEYQEPKNFRAPG